MTFLIDGYNLMHAIGLLRTGMPAGGLERARNRFLDWLAAAAKGKPAVLRVVFDAENGRGRSPESDYSGVRIRFAFRRTADDEIEDLLAAERRPDRVTVVSNDTRVQEAGRRRGTAVYTCEAFVDWLISGTPGTPPPAPPRPDKPEDAPSPDEMAAWLTAFTQPKRPKP